MQGTAWNGGGNFTIWGASFASAAPTADSYESSISSRYLADTCNHKYHNKITDKKKITSRKVTDGDFDMATCENLKEI